MKKIFILFLITSISIMLFAAEYEKGQTVYVTVNKLNFRSSPSLKGKRAGQFSLSQELVILEKGDEKEQIDDKYDYWYKVESKQGTGWVFGAFLTDQKVADKNELSKKYSGTYYFKNILEDNDYTRILKITNFKYIERKYNNYTGITDEIAGDVAYQADSIILLPKTRKIRPSVYINYPQNNLERQAYANAYYSWTDDPSYLKSIPRFKIDNKQIKLFIKFGKENQVYLVYKDIPAENQEFGYLKR